MNIQRNDDKSYSVLDVHGRARGQLTRSEAAAINDALRRLHDDYEKQEQSLLASFGI